MKVTVIKNDSNVAVIAIEGVIGTPAGIQFDNPGERIATYDAMQMALNAIRESGATRLIVEIRSTGGDVADALLIHDALRALKMQVTTRCFGYTASAATIIAQAASPGCREMSANGLYLIHRSLSGAEGNALGLAVAIDILEATDNRLAAIYAARSKRSAKSFLALMDENSGCGRWLSPQEAVDFGLVDRIIKPESMRNSKHAADTLNHEMAQIINQILTKKNKKMAEKKVTGAGLVARIGSFLTNAAKFMSPVNFDYVDAEGAVMFSTASETDDLAVGMEVAFPDDTTSGTFELPDGRVVTIEEFIVTAIDDAPDDVVAALQAENEALRAQLAEAVNLVEDMKAQIGSAYMPKGRLSKPSTATRAVKKVTTAATNADNIKSAIKAAHAAGFASKGIVVPRK